MNKLNKLLRKFLTGKDPVLLENPFVKNIATLLHKRGKLKSPDIKAMKEAKDVDLSGLLCEPEHILNYDATQFPEHLELFIFFKKSRLDNLGSGYGIKRVKGQMLLNIFVCTTEEECLRSPLNFMRISHEMCEASKAYGYTSRQYSDLYCVQFYFVRPVKGNMLQTFNKAWKDIEKLYNKSRNGIVKEIKKKY